MASPTEKLRRIEALWGRCRACALSRGRQRVVFTRGNPEAPLAIIGEAPGAEEDRQGEPFVGRAGELLDSLCERAGIEPWDCLIYNALGCRPPANRRPGFREIETCRPRLASLIMATRPRAILLLGATALISVTPYSRITQWRGKSIKASIPWRDSIIEIDAVGTFHPAYLLRDNSEELERIMIDDIRKARELSSDGSWVEKEIGSDGK